MKGKKILVVDEPGFAKVCSALLGLHGFAAETHGETDSSDLPGAGFDLVIASFPFGAEIVGNLRGRDVPVLVLADCLSRDLLDSVRSIRTSCCLIKPLDFDKFQSVVRRMLGCNQDLLEGCENA